MPSVPGYVHTPGHHCGSTALRNLLAFHGVEISEEMAFGLGAGACFYYLTLEDTSPSRWFNGRTARLEESFRELTGAALRAAHLRRGRRRGLGGGAGRGRRRQPGAAPHRHLLPRPLRQLGPLPRPRGGPGRLRRRGRPPLRHRLRGAADDAPGEPRQGPPQRPPRLPARRPHVHRRPTTVDREQLRGGDPARRSSGRRRRCSSRPSASSPACPRVERLAAEAGSWPEVGRGLAVVRPLRLPGDRAPRHRRRRLPADVLALPRGGGAGRRRRWRPRRRRAGPSWRGLPRGERERRAPSRRSGARSTPGRSGVAEAEERLWTALGG